MANKRIYKGISKVAIVSVLVTSLFLPFTSIAYAKDGDLWKGEKNIGGIGNILLKNRSELFKIIRNISGYDYEIGGKIYNAGKVNEEFKKVPNAAVESIHSTVKEKLAGEAKQLPATNEIVDFPDKELRKEIKSKLGKLPSEDIYKSELEKITEINILGNVKNFSGIENLTNLEKLAFSSVEIRDLSLLGNLINLKDLTIYSAQISDLSPLKNLTNLKYLTIRHTPISDLSALNSLTNLETLDLYNNQISNISVLKNLPNLQKLDLRRNQISDISSLKNLNHLNVLYLENNQISDISSLNNLINLQILWISNNQISDISSLESLIYLDYLRLYSNKITDLTPLKDLTDIREIYLHDNQISDVRPLRNLTNLRDIYLGNNQISDLDIQELKKYLINTNINTSDYVFIN